jgi:hypothetical protein
MKSKLFFLTFLSLCIVFFGCDKEEATIDTQYQLADEKTIDQNIETLSKLLATSLHGNVEFKSLIKQEIDYRFDHDYDALLLTFLGKAINGKAFEDILAESSNGKYKPADIVKMIKESGYIHLSIPVHFEAFDPSKEELLVFPISSRVEEKVTDELAAFDHLGNTIKFAAKDAPKVPVLVVMRSERIDEDGLLSVNEYGLVLPKEERIYYKEAINISKSMLKSARVRKHIVEIVSDEEYEKILKLNSTKVDENLSKMKGNHVLKSAIAESVLNASPKAARQIYLEWTPKPNSTRYAIYRFGFKNVNGQKVLPPGSSEVIAVLTNQCNYHDVVDYENEEYTYFIHYLDNQSAIIYESNKVSIHSSHRKNNGKEYVSAIKATSNMVVDLEGWWCSELELKINIVYINYEGATAEKEAGFNVDTQGSGAFSRDVDWSGYKNLFTWDRNSYRYAAYTIAIHEDDGGDRKKDSDDLWVDWIKFVVTEVANSQGVYVGDKVEQVAEQVKKTIKVLRNSDYVGQDIIKWWDPNEIVRELNPKGFSIIINHNPN